MREADVAQAVRILAEWNMAPAPASAERPEAEIAGIPVQNGFVAEGEAGIVGLASYVLLGSEQAQTEILAVHPKWLGRGIGALLQGARLAEMKSRGIRFVRTEADRPDVIDWYVRKFGYR